MFFVKSAIHLLFWLIASVIVIFIIGQQFFEFGVIGLYVIVLVDYIAMAPRGWIRHLPFALVGTTLGLLFYHFIIGGFFL